MRRALSHTVHAILCLALAAALGACGGEASVTVFPATPTPTPSASD
jgi:hypothetical protein